MKCFSRLAVVITAAALFAAPGMAKEVKIAYSVTVGDVAVYKMNMNGVTTIFVEDQTQQTVIDNEIFMTQKVVEVDPKTNIITFETKIDSGKMEINGLANPMPMVGQILQTQMLKNGEIIANAGAGGQNFNNLQLVFPEKAVTVGSTWSTDVPASAQVPSG